jgi:two-component system response regulator AtoC
MKKNKILIVDDEKNILRGLSATLREKRYEVETAQLFEEAVEKFGRDSYDLVLTDLKLPGKSGIDLLEYIKSREPEIPVIMMTAFGTIENAVEAMKRGAFNYLTKPVNPDELLTVSREAMEKFALRKENLSLKAELKQKHIFSNIIGRSPKMQEIFDIIRLVSNTQSNVLIVGESGTGKELVARAVHYNSSRAGKPFVTIDCAAIPSEIMESELFGHAKGAFTGAHEKKAGLLELANDGSVFLDEIGDLDLNLQKKMLRFIQEREFLPVGGVKRIRLDVRIIAATNKDLAKEVKGKKFREDLYYRLNVVMIRMPSLRERQEDIPLLANHILERLNRIEGKLIRGFDDDFLECLLKYDWPGNVRELENVLERAYILCPNVTISSKYLPAALRDLAQKTEVPHDEMNLMEIEKKLIIEALNRTSWNQSRSAEVLGITRKQLRTKMQKHKLLAS